MVSESSSDQVEETSHDHERGNVMDQDDKESCDKGMDRGSFLNFFSSSDTRTWHDCISISAGLEYHLLSNFFYNYVIYLLSVSSLSS